MCGKSAEMDCQSITRLFRELCRTAKLMRSRKRSGKKGFSTKANAPDGGDSAKTDPFAPADITISGVSILLAWKKRRSSMPLVPGISTSLMTQSLFHKADKLRTLSALPNKFVQ